MLTTRDEPVKLFSGVRPAMREMYCNGVWSKTGTRVVISSRTDQPTWACEILRKFRVRKDEDNAEPYNEANSFSIEDVMDTSLFEITSDSKDFHFKRLAKKSGQQFNEMVFFDNELGNCNKVSALGVTVGYCPGGFTAKIWQETLEKFPVRPGNIVGA